MGMINKFTALLAVAVAFGCAKQPDAKPLLLAGAEPPKMGASPDAIPIAATSPWLYGAAGGKTAIPAGETILVDTLYIDNQFGPVVNGVSKFASVIRWQGPPDRPIIAMRNCGYGDLGLFTVRLDNPASCIVSLSNLPTCPPGTVASTANRIHDIWFEGGGKATDCIRINSNEYGGPDQNNELHLIERCNFNGFTGNGVSVLSSQSHQNVVQFCTFANSGQVGTAMYARYGSQTFQRNNGGGLALIFNGQDQYAGAAHVVDNDFENCARFVDCRLPAGQWIIENNRCDGMFCLPGADNDYNTSAVFCHAGGYTSFRNNFLASQNGNVVRVLFGYNAGLNFVGNRFNANTAGAPHVVPLWSDPTQWADYKWYGNTWQNPAGVNTVIPHP